MPEIPYWKKLWVLFYTFAKIAALVVGGGYAILPVVEETFSKKNNWLTSEELLDMMGLVQTVPGIIACNSAIYVGRRVAGFGSTHDMPHMSGSIKDNGFDGHLCVHFLRNMDEARQNDPNYGVSNQETIRALWKQISGEDINY